MAAFRSVEIFSDSMRRVVAVERVDSRRSETSTGLQLYGTITPIAIIVCCRDRAYALDMDANPANLDRLGEDVPELKAIVSTLNEAQNRRSGLK